jgi:hypothetical protein
LLLPINAENTSEKIQLFFTMKVLKKLLMDILNIIKSMYSKPIASIVLKGES